MKFILNIHKLSVNPGLLILKHCKTCLIFFLFLLITFPVKSVAQNKPGKGSGFQDTSFMLKHSPQKATLYSMVLPGLGQAYNRKYWKIPIVYAGFGVMSYFIIMNNNEYVKFKEAYDYVTAGDTAFPINNEYVHKYDAEQLSRARDYYRRNLELSCILTGVWYIMNVIDATVDAHLFDYDISEDLSIKLKPVNNNSAMLPGITPGISVTYRF